MDSQLLPTFEYQALDVETRLTVQQEDKEFDRNMGDAGRSFLHACHNIKRIHDALKYKRPGFVEYCQSKSELSQQTANRMIKVAEMLPESSNIFGSKEALYLLASSSTPEAARLEAITRAQDGEPLTRQTAQAIVSAHTAQPQYIKGGYYLQNSAEKLVLDVLHVSQPAALKFRSEHGLTDWSPILGEMLVNMPFYAGHQPITLAELSTRLDSPKDENDLDEEVKTHLDTLSATNNAAVDSNFATVIEGEPEQPGTPIPQRTDKRRITEDGVILRFQIGEERAWCPACAKYHGFYIAVGQDIWQCGYCGNQYTDDAMELTDQTESKLPSKTRTVRTPEERLAAQVLTPGKYRAILLDPPWEYDVYSEATGHGRSAESYYPTMTIEEMMELPVGELADTNCAMFMWVTWPTIHKAFALGAHWGFTYKTAAFTWAKQTASSVATPKLPIDANSNWHMGMGFWTRANPEPCLLFTKGSPVRLAADVRQLIVAPIGAHSQKPDEQYTRIERLVPGPYVELFARSKREGWDVWGNQVESSVSLTSNGVAAR